MAACKRCGEPIVWKKRPGAKPYEPRAFVALDPAPDPSGMYAIVNDRAVSADAQTPKDAPRHHAHAVFCEGAGKARRTMQTTET